MSEHKDELEEVAKLLLEKEIAQKEELEQILGKRKAKKVLNVEEWMANLRV